MNLANLGASAVFCKAIIVFLLPKLRRGFVVYHWTSLVEIYNIPAAIDDPLLCMLK